MVTPCTCDSRQSASAICVEDRSGRMRAAARQAKAGSTARQEGTTNSTSAGEQENSTSAGEQENSTSAGEQEQHERRRARAVGSKGQATCVPGPGRVVAQAAKGVASTVDCRS